MMNCRKRAFGVLAAVILCGSLSAAMAQIEGQTVQGFRLPEHDKDGKLKQLLHGETATFLPDGIISLTGLKIEIYNNDEVTARVFSPKCAYDSVRKRAASKEHIRVVTEKAVLTGDGFAWNGENEQFQIFKNAKVTIDGQMDASLLAPKPDPSPESAVTKE